jgi:hypothetical protein
MTLIVKPLVPRTETTPSPVASAAGNTSAYDIDISAILGSDSIAFVERTEIRFEQLANHLSPGKWRKPDFGNYLEKEAMNNGVSVARAQWHRALPDLDQNNFRPSGPLICPAPGGVLGKFRCAFLQVCLDSDGDYLWLVQNGTLSAAATTSHSGNFWLVHEDDSFVTETIHTPDSVAEVMINVRSGAKPPPDWLAGELAAALKQFESRRLQTEIRACPEVVAHELEISRTGLMGLSRSSIGQHEVALGVDSFGRPSVRVMCSTKKSDHLQGIPDLDSL